MLKKISFGVSGGGSYDRTKFASKATATSPTDPAILGAWRRDHQVVVMEQSETEDHSVSQRTVRNNNHCHVLNIFYHEVLNNYQVTTKMLGHRKVYFVPYEVKEFDLHMALCAKSILLPHLIDGSLAQCYDRLKINRRISATKTTVADEFKIDVKIGAARGHQNSDNLFLLIRTVSRGIQQFPVNIHEIWNSGQNYSYTVNTPNFDPSEIHEAESGNYWRRAFRK